MELRELQLYLLDHELFEVLGPDDPAWRYLVGAEVVHEHFGVGTICEVVVQKAPFWPYFYVQFEDKKARFNEGLFPRLSDRRLRLCDDDPLHSSLVKVVHAKRVEREHEERQAREGVAEFGNNCELIQDHQSASVDASASEENVGEESATRNVSWPEANRVARFIDWIRSGVLRVCQSIIPRPREVNHHWIEVERSAPKWMGSQNVAFSNVTEPGPTQSDAYVPSQMDGVTSTTNLPLTPVSDALSYLSSLSGPRSIHNSSVTKDRDQPRKRSAAGQGHSKRRYRVPTAVRELHYIAPIQNLESIMTHGILSHNLAQAYNPHSVAMRSVNDRRRYREIADGWMVHDHANLYFNARNPMMYVRRNQHRSLCVLRISPEVLQEEWVAISDGNAASAGTVISVDRERGLSLLDFNFLYRERWNDVVDGKRKRCAEALVLHRVPFQLITGVYVSCVKSRDQALQKAPHLPVTVDEHMFFSLASEGSSYDDFRGGYGIRV